MPARDAINVVAWGDPYGFSLRMVQLNGRVMREAHFPGLTDRQYHTVALNTSGLRSGFYALVHKSYFPGGALAVRGFTIVR